ncbi:unnamed protein product, partial [marine sediment metagenome]
SADRASVPLHPITLNGPGEIHAASIAKRMIVRLK